MIDFNTTNDSNYQINDTNELYYSSSAIANRSVTNGIGSSTISSSSTTSLGNSDLNNLTSKSQKFLQNLSDGSFYSNVIKLTNDQLGNGSSYESDTASGNTFLNSTIIIPELISNINDSGIGYGYDISSSINTFNDSLNRTNEFDDQICADVYDPTLKLNEFEFWVSGVILNLVGILGIFGNILSMVILSRPQMRSSINYLLIGLARCDTVLIITSMLLFGIPAIYPYTGYLFYYYYYIYPNISPCLYPIAMASQTASVYLTFTVTLERYVAVCHPLRARALCTYGRAKVYVIVCILFALLYNLPRFWEVIVIAYAATGDDVIFCVTASKLRRNQNYIRVYIHWCYLFFIYFIPFFSLAILNCLIYRQVQKANRERQRLSRTERREIGLATMLLCVVIVFFLLNFLALYTNILEAFYDIINDYLVKTSNLLVTINSSANFIIYVIFGEKFKRIFLLLFCKGRMTRDTPDLIHYESSISNGDNANRSSGRFSRHGTQRSTMIRNGTTSVRITRSKRNRAPSPGPCVYYPARDIQRTTTLTPSASINCDWDNKNGLMTSGF